MPPVVVSQGRLLSLERAPSFESGLVTSVHLYNDRLLDYSAIFRTQPHVRTVVDFLARNIAQLGVHLYERVDDNDRRRLTDHPFTRRLRKPNPADRRSNRYRFIYQLVQNVCIYDTAFGVLLGDHPTDGPAIVIIPPKSVRLTGSSWLWPDGYRIARGSGHLDLTPDQVIHLQGSANLDDPRIGVSPIEALRSVLAEEDSAAHYRDQFWKAGARVSGWVHRPTNAPRWSPGARTRFKNELANDYSGNGPNAGGVALLEDGMTFNEGGMSARDAQYIESRKLSREEVASAYHINPANIGILDNANFSNMKEQHRNLYMDTLGPWLTMLDLDLTNQLLPAYVDNEADLEDLYVEINFREKLRGSLEEEADAITKLTGAPTLTRNEGRALLNRNALDGGDALITPLNVVVGGQTVPGESPPGAPAREVGENALDHPTTKALTAGAKAAGYSDALADNHVANHVTQLERYFTRLRAEIESTRGAAPYADLSELFDRTRWDNELRQDLAGLSEVTALAYADLLSEAWDFNDFDPDRLTPLIAANTASAAGHLNDSTEADLAAALADEDTGAAITHLFGVYATARIPSIARARTAWAGNHGRNEVASQSGRTAKVWRVTSSNPRSSHAALSGESVPIGERFSNGMAWPGDPAGGSAEVANCTCILEFT